MVLTEFFENILNVSGDLQTKTNVTFQSSAFEESIKDTTFVTTNVLSPSIIADSTSIILQNLKNSFFDVTRINLLALGAASEEISFALDEQIIIRERQRAVDIDQANNLQIQLNVLNERLSSQVSEIGQSLTKLGESGSPLEFLTNNPIIAGIGIGGLLVGGIILFVVLKK